MSDKSQINLFCGKCLVNELPNQKITSIDQSKEIILQIKNQKKEIKTKENQARHDFYKNILDKIMDFKRSIDDSLDKIYRQIQQYMFPILKEKQELQDTQQLNYFEDIKSLSELYSLDQQKSQKLNEDDTFLDLLMSQFEQLFNNAEYLQTLDTFKNTKQIVQDLMENDVIQLPPLLFTKNETKTSSLNRICKSHNKEIIMIDMDSQNKQVEDRLVCVECITENPQIKYQSIENVNKQWVDYYSQYEKMLLEYKKESQIKKSDLFNQIANMRKNYNEKLNEISEKLIVDYIQSTDRLKEYNKIKKRSIQTLEDEHLLKDLKLLVEKEQLAQNSSLINLKKKDVIFRKEFKHHLETLREYNQQDIQQSLDKLKEIPMERNIFLQFQQIIQQFSKNVQDKVENYQDQIEIIEDIQEFIDEAKKYQSQLNLFDQTLSLYQQHCSKIDKIQQKILNQTKDQVNKSELFHSQYQNLSNVLNDYIANVDNKSKEIKKYSNIKQLEKELVELQDLNQNLEDEKQNLLESLDQQNQEHLEAITQCKDEYLQQIEEITQELKEKEEENFKLKEQFDEEIINLKQQNKEDLLKSIQELEDKQSIEIKELNNKLNQKKLELTTVQSKLFQIHEEEYKLEFEKQINQQFQKELQFSNIQKHNNYQVTGDKRVVESSNGGYCLCEQEIANTGKTVFAFQILKIISSVNIRIGFRDIIQKNNYCSYGFGKGSYSIKSDGYTYSHHDKDVDNKQLSFTFTTNDIIVVEVSIEHNYIKRIKNNKPQSTFQLQIDTSTQLKLYPCVILVMGNQLYQMNFHLIHEKLNGQLIIQKIWYINQIKYYKQFEGFERIPFDTFQKIINQKESSKQSTIFSRHSQKIYSQLKIFFKTFERLFFRNINSIFFVYDYQKFLIFIFEIYMIKEDLVNKNQFLKYRMRFFKNNQMQFRVNNNLWLA